MKRMLSLSGKRIAACVVVILFAMAAPNTIAAPRLPLTTTAPAAGVPNSVKSARPSKVVTVSWYGPHHHGRRTASGEIFDATAFTAAHRTLPFGTLLTVTNPENGRTVTVRVNDRGPFVKGRALDLSEAAARAIGVHAKGVAKVMVIHPEE